jgi:amidase
MHHMSLKQTDIGPTFGAPVGPMTKIVKDGAYVPQSIAGADPFDNYASATPSQVDLNFVDACQLSALAGARLGVPRNVISLM